MQSKLRKQAIEWIQTGKKNQARRLLESLVQQEPGDELSWFWLAEAQETPAEGLRVLEKYQKIDPTNLRTQRAILKYKTNPASKSFPIRLPFELKLRLDKTVIVLGGLLLFSALIFIISLSVWHGQMKAEGRRYDALLAEYVQLSQDYQGLFDRHTQLESQYTRLKEEHLTLQERYEALQNTIQPESAASGQNLLNLITPPFLTVHTRVVTISFLKRDRSVLVMEFPYSELQGQLEKGSKTRLVFTRQTTLWNNPQSRLTQDMLDYGVFVDPEPFRPLITSIYPAYTKDGDFIEEMWQVTGQLDTYYPNISDTPHYPLETLLAGGADNEDSAILLASLLAAAPNRWKISLVLTDSGNPSQPVTINHMLVYIDSGAKTYLIDPTNRSVMQPYPQGVVGWYSQVK